MKSVIALLVVPWIVILRGWVLVTLWGWFVVPQFNVTPMRIPIALGISCLFSSFTANLTEKKDPDAEWWHPLVASPLVSLLTLGLAWIFHLFV